MEIGIKKSLLSGISALGGLLYVAGAQWVYAISAGLFLLATGAKMLFFAGEKPDLEKNPALRWMRGHLALTKGFEGEKFWVIKDGVRTYTPLFLVLAMIAGMLLYDWSRRRQSR